MIPGIVRAKWNSLRSPLPPKGSLRRAVLALCTAAVLLLVVPFTFWYWTWHGWSLDEAEVAQGLSDPRRKGRMQRQITLIAERADRGDFSVRKFYPRIAELSRHHDAEVRALVAWMMGKDPDYAAFRQELRRMLVDEAPIVRHPAALSLAQFGDPSARTPLEKMLQPLTVASTATGRIQQRIQPGDSARTTTVVARVDAVDVLSPVTGTVRRWLVGDGADVRQGQPLLELDQPAQQMELARAALRRLAAR